MAIQLVLQSKILPLYFAMIYIIDAREFGKKKYSFVEKLKSLLKEITQLTLTIESKYPELYRFLDEEPSTIPNEAQPEIDIRSMQGYLESLKQILEHYKETHEK